MRPTGQTIWLPEGPAEEVTTFRSAPSRTVILESPTGQELLRLTSDADGAVTAPPALVGPDWPFTEAPDGSWHVRLPADIAGQLASPADLALRAEFQEGDRPIPPGPVLDATETATTNLTITNQGTGPAFDIRIEAATDQPNVAAKILASSDGSPWPELAPGGTRTAHVQLTATQAATTGRVKITFRARESRGYDAKPVILEIPTRALATPRFEVRNVEITDGSAGLARGNGNRVAESGETVQLVPTVGSVGEGPGVQVKVKLESLTPGVEVGHGEAEVPMFLVGETHRPAFSLSFARTFAGASARYRLTITDVRNVGTFTKDYELPVRALAPVLVQAVEVVEGLGNGNGVIENGERVDVLVTVRNDGTQSAQDVQVQASCGEGLTLAPSSAALGTLAPGEAAPRQRFSIRLPRNFDKAKLPVILVARQAGFPEARKTEEVSIHLLRPELVLSLKLFDEDRREVREIPQGGSGTIEATVQNRGGLAAEGVTISLRTSMAMLDLGPSRGRDIALTATPVAIPPGRAWTQTVSIGVRRAAQPGALAVGLEARQAGGFADASVQSDGWSIVAEGVPPTPVAVDPGPIPSRPGGAESPQGVSGPVGASRHAPTVRILALSETSQAQVVVSVIVEDDQPLPDNPLTVMLNGQILVQSRGVGGVTRAAPSRSLEADYTVTLRPGENVLLARVIDRDGEPGEDSRTIVYHSELTRPYERIWAVVVGISRYRDASIPTIPNARNDAEAVARQFLARGVARERLFTLLDDAATKQAIEIALGERLAGAGERDALIVYFAGHGISVGTGRREVGYIVPYDGSLDRTTAPSRDISMGALGETLRAVNVNHRLTILDSCFSGLLLTKRSGSEQVQTPEALKSGLQVDVCQVLTAGQSGEQAADAGAARPGHSVFTHYLLSALEGREDARGGADQNGDGFLTFTELAAYVKARVPAAAQAAGHTQNPQMGNLFGEGEFLFPPVSNERR